MTGSLTTSFPSEQTLHSPRFLFYCPSEQTRVLDLFYCASEQTLQSPLFVHSQLAGPLPTEISVPVDGCD